MELKLIQQQFVDYAWRDGADCLERACSESGGDITADQLKMLIARGERQLVKLVDMGETEGWAVFRIDQLPNMRVFMITELAAKDHGRFFEEVKNMARAFGCSVIRAAAKPAQERLYRMKCGFEPVYTIVEVQI